MSDASSGDTSSTQHSSGRSSGVGVGSFTVRIRQPSGPMTAACGVPAGIQTAWAGRTSQVLSGVTWVKEPS